MARSTRRAGLWLLPALLLVPPARAQEKDAPGPAAATPALTPLAHVEERGAPGEGRPDLVLVPGLLCDWRVYDAFMTRNAGRYRMLAVTLPGFGGSAPPDLPTGAQPGERRWLDNAERAVLALIEERKLEKPVLVGHSLGGMLALDMAVRHPGGLAGVISIDGLPVYPPPTPGRGGKLDTPEARNQASAQLVATLLALPEAVYAQARERGVRSMVKDEQRGAALVEMCAAVPRTTGVEYLAETATWDLRAGLAKAAIPVLVISAVSMDYGAEEMQRVRAAVAGEFEGAPERVRVIFFEGTRHFVMDDRPAELDRAVEAFLKGKTPEGITAEPEKPPAPAEPPKEKK